MTVSSSIQYAFLSSSTSSSRSALLPCDRMPVVPVRVAMVCLLGQWGMGARRRPLLPAGARVALVDETLVLPARLAAEPSHRPHQVARPPRQRAAPAERGGVGRRPAQHPRAVHAAGELAS